MPTAEFRGFVAPASLKPEGQHRACARCRQFRGFVAPASLKRRTVYENENERAHRQFRGFVAPASLKQDAV